MQTATVRDRGQITIPEKLRSVYDWLKSGSVVSVSSVEDGVKITPYKKDTSDINWENVWERIYLVRSFKGKRGNLSEFVISDREKH